MPEQNQYQAPQANVETQQEQILSTPKIFGVSGRIGRVRYLAYTIGVPLLLLLVLALFGGITAAVIGIENPAIFVTFGGIFYIGALVFQFMATIQRCHDFDVSGWLSLLLFVPIAPLIFWFIPGTPRENNFGHPPIPNHAGVIIAALLMPLVFVVGMLAAIAIPAYQGYLETARQSQQFEQDR